MGFPTTSTTVTGPAPAAPSGGCETLSSPVIDVLTVEASRLAGTVEVSGAKNSVLRLLAATLLTREPIILDNVPLGLLDARIHLAMLERLGKTWTADGTTVTITEDAARPLHSRLAWEGRSIRNTLLILGALVARTGQGAVPLPGGCSLGERKFDLHELVLRRLGAEVTQDQGMLMARAPDGLRGADIHLPIRSTGATENAILCGSLARGRTTVWNPHVRPEILDLIRLLRAMGAHIEVRGQESIRIDGVPVLGGAWHSVIPDNMEALTWLIAATVTGGDVEILNFPFADLEVPLIFLRESGARTYRCDDALVVRSGRCYPLDISTGPYPGINSDMQPLFAAFGVQAKGMTRIVDLRFPDRYGYATELARLGADIRVEDNMLRIHGGRTLVGTDVVALDLRAGIALLLAGLSAQGTTTIHQFWQVQRGYDDIVGKLSRLGARITPLSFLRET